MIRDIAAVVIWALLTAAGLVAVGAASTRVLIDAPSHLEIQP